MNVITIGAPDHRRLRRQLLRAPRELASKRRAAHLTDCCRDRVSTTTADAPTGACVLHSLPLVIGQHPIFATMLHLPALLAG